MGNKITLGNCAVIYCGFPAQRRRTKCREVEKRWEKGKQERYAIWLRAEKFKADFPEYCIQAGIPPSSLIIPNVEQTSKEKTVDFKSRRKLRIAW